MSKQNQQGELEKKLAELVKGVSTYTITPKKHDEAEVKRYIATINWVHRTAYNNAVDQLLRDDEGLVDYERLEDEKVRYEFDKKMREYYLEKAEAVFGVKKEIMSDVIREGELIMAYTGVDSKLSDYISRYKKDFKFEVFDRLRTEEFMPNIIKVIYRTIGKELREDEVRELTKL